MADIKELEETIRTLRTTVAVQEATIENLQEETIIWQKIIMNLHQAFEIEKDMPRVHAILEAFMAEFTRVEGLEDYEAKKEEGMPSC